MTDVAAATEPVSAAPVENIFDDDQEEHEQDEDEEDDDVVEIDGVLTLTIHDKEIDLNHNPKAPVELSNNNAHKSSYITLQSSSGRSGNSALLDTCFSPADVGYCMVRATHSVSEGSWYFEVQLGDPDKASASNEAAEQLKAQKLRKQKQMEQDDEAALAAVAVSDSALSSPSRTAAAIDVAALGTFSPKAASASSSGRLSDVGLSSVATTDQLNPHWRIGWSRLLGDVKAPVGFDKYSYAIRDLTGEIYHQSIGMPYGERFGDGDTIGCYIYLPPSSVPIEDRVHVEKEDYIEDNESRCIIHRKFKEEVAQGSRICFFKNGKCLGDAFTNINYAKYYPAISLYMGAKCKCIFGPEGLKYFAQAQELDANVKPIGALYDATAAAAAAGGQTLSQKKSSSSSSKNKKRLQSVALAAGGDKKRRAVMSNADAAVPTAVAVGAPLSKTSAKAQLKAHAEAAAKGNKPSVSRVRQASSAEVIPVAVAAATYGEQQQQQQEASQQATDVSQNTSRQGLTTEQKKLLAVTAPLEQKTKRAGGKQGKGSGMLDKLKKQVTVSSVSPAPSSSAAPVPSVPASSSRQPSSTSTAAVAATASATTKKKKTAPSPSPAPMASTTDVLPQREIISNPRITGIEQQSYQASPATAVAAAPAPSQPSPSLTPGGFQPLTLQPPPSMQYPANLLGNTSVLFQSQQQQQRQTLPSIQDMLSASPSPFGISPGALPSGLFTPPTSTGFPLPNPQQNMFNPALGQLFAAQRLQQQLQQQQQNSSLPGSSNTDRPYSASDLLFQAATAGLIKPHNGSNEQGES